MYKPHDMKNIALLFGGFTGEAEISRKSAVTIKNNLTVGRVIEIEVSRENWTAIFEDGERAEVNKNDFSVVYNGDEIRFDFVFNMIHGSPGEDGRIASYLDMLNIPYSSSGHLSSALSASKGFCNKFLSGQGFPVAKSKIVVSKDESIEGLKLPVFVKPNGGGSSIATVKVEEMAALPKAIEDALIHDKEVLVEEFISGREFTCGVAEWEGEIQALQVTEIICESDFFDYKEKYSEDGAKEVTPADISKDLENQIKEYSEQIFKSLDLKNMARIDFLGGEDKLTVLEVNTIPGFSPESIFPQQLEAHGINMTNFLDQMVLRSLK